MKLMITSSCAKSALLGAYTRQRHCVLWKECSNLHTHVLWNCTVCYYFRQRFLWRKNVPIPATFVFLRCVGHDLLSPPSSQSVFIYLLMSFWNVDVGFVLDCVFNTFWALSACCVCCSWTKIFNICSCPPQKICIFAFDSESSWHALFLLLYLCIVAMIFLLHFWMYRVVLLYILEVSCLLPLHSMDVVLISIFLELSEVEKFRNPEHPGWMETLMDDL